jgi:mannosyltransferase
MTTRPAFRLSRSYAAQAEDGAWLSLKNRIWLWIALAAAFFARVNALDAQSLWNDEGTSVALARTSVNAIVNAAAHDIHPPLYYILLHYWIQAAGISEFALRFLSVVAGVLVVALTFRIAREFFDQDVAVIAAVVSALNAFQTYYAQETRMYIWVTLFACVSVWAMTHWLKPLLMEPQSARRVWSEPIAFFMATLAALYTNYYAFTLVLIENVAFVVWLILVWRRGARPLAAVGAWIAVNLFLVLMYVPWLVFARASLTAWPGISAPMTLWEMAWRILSAYITGADSLLNWQTLLVITYLFFSIGGLMPSRDLFKQSAWGIVTCALWAFVPLFAMYVVSLARPAYNPKFLLLATPGFLILVGRGVSVLYPGLFLRERAPYASLSDPMHRRVARQLVGIGKLFVGVLFAAGTVLALQNMYTDPRLQRDDYRGIIRYINALATNRDAVIVDAPGQMDVVRYYYHGAAELSTLPIGRPVLQDQTRAAIVDLIKRHDRLFAIYWATDQADPEQFVERSLSEVSYKASDEWHGNVRLAEYAVSLLPSSFDARIPFGDEIFLRSFSIEDKAYAGGDIIPLDLTWVALKPLSINYKVFAHLVDAHGQLVAQHDGEPENGFSPTNRWQVGEEVSDKVGILVPVGIPPGEYSIVIGLYRGDTGERLKLKDGTDALTLGSLTIDKRIVTPDALFLNGKLNAAFDAVRALGYNLERDGANGAVYQRGEFIPVVLYWQAVTKPVNDLALSVQLVDTGNDVIATARAFENYPTSRWEQNEIVRDVQTLAIPANALTGEYKIVLSDGARNFDVTKVVVR